jgi:hypothetical protein
MRRLFGRTPGHYEEGRGEEMRYFNEKRDKRDKEAYQKICDALKSSPSGGATIADIVAKTALPINTVRELVPVAADEFSGRLEVTESGEILYSFPHGWSSKYHGFKALCRRAGETVFKGLKTIGAGIFKVWTGAMLLGYFILFVALALASVALSVVISSSGRSSDTRGGGIFFVGGLFDIIIRIWFFSEIAQPASGRRPQSRAQRRWLHEAIFSFIFGDKYPEKATNIQGISVQERQAIIDFIQTYKGVISLPEFMIFTGLAPAEAETAITRFCLEYGGSPEVTDEGTIVYLFNDLLLNARHRPGTGQSATKPLKVFSSNTKEMNRRFIMVNGFNLFFGLYFLLSPVSSFLHAVTHIILEQFHFNPSSFITIGLGIVPVVFSVLFWLIPGLRSLHIKRDNEKIKQENLRKIGYSMIWDSPSDVQASAIKHSSPECMPEKIAEYQAQIIKEMSEYSPPEVTAPNGVLLYHFPALKRERDVLNQYRDAIQSDRSALGGTVFDTEA